MRFVSKYPQLGLGTARTEKFVLALDGQRERTTYSLPVQFSQGALLRGDIDAALAHWPEKSFTGRWLEPDGVTQQPVAERIGVFDTVEAQATNGWTDSEREAVEEWLLRKPNLGIDFIQVEKHKQAPPWPTYDKMQWKQIAPFAADAGLVDEAIAYEQENGGRESVLGMLEKAKGKPAAAATEADDLVAA